MDTSLAANAPEELPARRVVIGPNASLSAEQAAWFLAGICGVSFGIAALFAWRGYWLVLPFAGLEMLALAAGLWWSLRGNAYREVITITRQRVRIEVGRRHPQYRWEFPRHWARVWSEPAGGRPGAEDSLILGYGGQRCEIGACLTNEERGALARRLRQLLAASGADDANGDDRV